ncbi:MAG: 2-oxoacid:acceptor oxidoreductase family protein [Polyangiaceae bacterium]|nr:2-oxoacid:acceptor oxidoreductase family protein [Polyangiaceae bacterium]
MTLVKVDVVIAGLGGQGVLKASDILAEAAFLAGHDVKKSEIHGMAQRGGSVHSDVRFGSCVLSPMITPGEADYLLVLEATEVEPHRHRLRPEGRLITPAALDPALLPSKRSLNVGILAVLARELTLPIAAWHAAIDRQLRPDLAGPNRELFTRVFRYPSLTGASS